MDYGWVFSRKIRCSNEDKRQCLWLVGEMITLAKKARDLGVLSLVDNTDASPGDMESFLRGLERASPCLDWPDGLNATMGRLNDEDIQHCLREIGTMDLAKAFKSFNPNIRLRVFNNLPQRGAMFLREVIEHMEAVAPSDAAEAQERIAAILSDLQTNAPDHTRTPMAE